MDILKVARVPATLVPPSMTVYQASSLMVHKQVGAVLVVNTDEQIIGIFTERDNLVRVTVPRRDLDKTTLQDVMTTPVITAAPDMCIREALGLLIRKQFRHLPIIDKDQRVLGIASIRYLLLRRLSETISDLDAMSAYVSAGGPG